jgi:hypothetical protein
MSRPRPVNEGPRPNPINRWPDEPAKNTDSESWNQDAETKVCTHSILDNKNRAIVGDFHTSLASRTWA